MEYWRLSDRVKMSLADAFEVTTVNKVQMADGKVFR